MIHRWYCYRKLINLIIISVDLLIKLNQLNQFDNYADFYNSLDEDFEMTNTTQKPVDVAPKVGSNDPCPYGSGKKYKKYCMSWNQI